MKQKYLRQSNIRFALLLLLTSVMSVWASNAGVDSKINELISTDVSSKNALNINDTSCGYITGIYIYDQATDASVYGPIQDNAQININSLPNNYYLVTQTSGNVESITYLVGNSYIVENVSLYTYPAGGSNWNAGVGSYNVSVKAYKYDNANGQKCDYHNVSFDIVNGSSNITPPSSPTCSSGSFLWENNINVNNLTGNSGVPEADVRLKDGGDTQFTIPGPYPTEFNSAVTVSLDEVVSWDGYTNRVNINQGNEKWKVVFKKDGNIVFESSYTQDVDDNVTSAEWVGPLESNIFLPNGTDAIIIVHYEDSQLGEGSVDGVSNSVAPSSICVSYETPEIVAPSDPTCDNGSFLWENNIDVTTLEGSNLIPVADLRFKDGGDTQFTIPGPYPIEFSGAVTVSLDEVISWDGYGTRANTVAQNNEKWKVVFKKNGNIVFESSYTQDIADNVVSAEWIGSLESNIYLANGTDEIILVHSEDPTLGEGSIYSSSNSVVPSSICISYVASTASLGDTVFLDEDQDGIQDADEEGVAGVTVNLLDCNNNQLATTTTDANGNYVFADLDPNEDYKVEFEVPTGYELSPSNQGSNDSNDSDANANGRTSCIDLAPGEDNPTIDAGIYLPSASLGDTVFLDEDQDGIQDADEEGVAGVTVNLLDCNNNQLATTTTDANGNYVFADLDPNEDYKVEFEVPTGYELSPSNQGSNDSNDSDANPNGRTSCIDLAPGEDNLTIDAGVYLPSASLGDTVFLDEDQDGIQDADEEGVAGVTVNLLDCNNNQLATTTTDANGNYFFADLDPNEDYKVEFEVPTGYELSPSNQGSNDSNDSDANANGRTSCIDLAPGEDNPTIDAGIYLPSASLGDTVFLDEDQDGIQDADEEGVAGVTVNLLDCNNNQLATTTTDANGNYFFADLDPNEDYKVEFEVPTGYELSPSNQGNNDSSDSDANPNGRTSCIDLAPGENNPTIDAGIYLPSASLGDTVFLDEDQDGIQDAGEEGVAGVTVNLLDCNNNELATTTTDANGNYVFADLDPNEDYKVEFEVPTGYELSPSNQGSNDSNDSDANANGRTSCIDLAPGEDNPTIDAGIYLPSASLGDTVFLDEDQDGIQDADEEGVAGVTVNLLDCNNNQLATTTTDANGNYVFADLDPNEDYKVEFEVPTGYELSPSNQGNNDSNDSDANANGRTSCIDLAPGENNPTIDAGIYLPCSIDPSITVSTEGNNDNTICYGDDAVLTAAGGDQFVWKANDVVIPNESSNTLTVSPTETTVYTVVVTDSSQFDCSAEAITTIAVNPPTENTVEEVSVCAGSDYTWSQNGMTYTAADSPVMLTINDNNGCSYTATLVINEYEETEDIVNA
uniref:SdrD B-like domain-containing protein n=1 Tax=uncultured Winogradskyella sp. TaxID=395353 RepID=UPI00262B787B